MVLMVAASLLTVGYAHKPALSAADVAKADYLLGMGLTSADLCSTPGDDGTGMAMGDCPVCHLAASAALHTPMDGVKDIELRAAAAVFVPAEAHIFGRRTNPATPARAPPFGLIA